MNPVVRFLQHFYFSALHKDKHDWEIILYCIGTGFLFWFLNAMGKVYHHQVSVPVDFQYSRNSVVAVSSLPKTVEVQVEGRGWDIAREIWGWEPKLFKYKVARPLEVDFVVPQKWHSNLQDMLPSVKVEGVVSDTIFMRFDKIDKKLVGLYVDLQDIKLKEGFQISSPIQISPKFIEFKGAASLIKNLPPQLPVKIDARNISESFDQNISLDFSQEYPKNQLLNYDQDAVNVQFTVRPSLEEEMQIPIEIVNGKIYPNLYLKEHKVGLTFLISDKDKRLIRTEDFQVTADMETFNPADSTVNVSLAKKPKVVSDVQIGITKTRVYAR